MDPLNDLAGFILGKIKEGLYAQWLKFLFELSFSAIVSFLFVCGTTLVATRSTAVAIGSGMVMAAMALAVLFRREQSRLTKGMIVVLPGDEAAREIDTSIQVIQKEKGK